MSDDQPPPASPPSRPPLGPPDEPPGPPPEGAPASGVDHDPRPRASAVQITARVLLAVVLLGGPIVGGWVGLDLLSVRRSLQEARSALTDVRGALGDVDVDEAAAALAVAEEELADARRRAGRPTWSVAALMPVVGPTVDVTRQVVEVASAAVELTAIVVTEGQELLADGLDVELVDGRVDLEPLLVARDLVRALPIERLVTARDALAAPQERWVPEEVRQGRIDTLALADDTLRTLVAAEALAEALPGFLGADGPRRYFVGIQTSAELRGTGGLIGYWGLLGVDDGRIVFGQGESYDPFDDVEAPEGEPRTARIGQVGLLSMDDPPGVDPEYLGRYATVAGARSFPNINLDPDLPTAGKAILDLFEHRTGERLDGVVLLDPLGVQAMLEATGPILPLSDELSELLGLDGGLPTEDLARFVTVDVYETLGFARSDERNAALREVGDAALQRIFEGSWEGTRMLRAIGWAASERHLQVHTTDEPVQAAFDQVRATGSLALPDDADLVAVTANNAVGGKQDVHLGHAFRLDLQLSDLGHVRGEDELTVGRSGTLEVGVDNPLPPSGMDEYVIGNCYLPGRANRCFEGEPGWNRTWFSLWASPRTWVVGFDSDDGSAPGRYTKTFRGLRVVDHIQLTPPRGQAAFRFELDGRAPARIEPGSVVYELLWWRQAKAIPDLLDVMVRPPEGWVVDRVEVIGGGDGQGMGVHGDGVELTAEVVDGAARLHGTVTADTRLKVHLVGADG